VWYRNRRSRKKWSLWHYDDTPPMPSCMHNQPVNLKQLPLSICKTAYHDLGLAEESVNPPLAEDCCKLCLKALKEKATPKLGLILLEGGGE
jgi:hypothetical protein